MVMVMVMVRVRWCKSGAIHLDSLHRKALRLGLPKLGSGDVSDEVSDDVRLGLPSNRVVT